MDDGLKGSLLQGIRAVILDIEGTTTPIAFVKENLFPYVKNNVKTYLEKNFDILETQEDIEGLRQQAEKDVHDDVEGLIVIPQRESHDRDVIIDSVVKNVLWQMNLDRKTTALKTIQGHMWREAFQTGRIHGEVYDDVVPALKKFVSKNFKVYIYSSGSIEAQKLLFGYSTFGNILKFFSGHFDTTIGAKVETDSYRRIATNVGEPSSNILFLTDLPKEAIAARDAGMRTFLVVREGNARLTDADHEAFLTIDSFEKLFDES